MKGEDLAQGVADSSAALGVASPHGRTVALDLGAVNLAGWEHKNTLAMGQFGEWVGDDGGVIARGCGIATRGNAPAGLVISNSGT